MIKINLFSALFMLSLSFLPMKTFAFHNVTEILSDNTLLVCRDADQVRNGDKIEEYAERISGSKRHNDLVKVKEFDLPKVGQKVELVHNEFGLNEKRPRIIRGEKIGVGTITLLNLEGKSRKTIEIGDSKSSRIIEKNKEISKSDALEIQKNCIGVIPDAGVRIKEVSSIIF